jgi:hypothetical protein
MFDRERSKYCADRFMRENAKDSGDKRVDSRPKHEHEPAQLARMNWLSAILDRVRPFGADEDRSYPVESGDVRPGSQSGGVTMVVAKQTT